MSATGLYDPSEVGATDSQRPLFLSMMCRYSVDPGADLPGLLEDFRCLFGSGMDAIQTESDSFTGAQWAGVYALRQAGALFELIDDKARALEHDRLNPAKKGQTLAPKP
jgi:hypothetical protein